MSVLAPEHREDLNKSGLTEATTDLMQVAAVPPGKIKLRGVESAYAIPYFHLDGSRNDFQRVKVFPPIKTDHGTLRYHQPPNTAPHLYYAPVLNWESVARRPTTELVVTEGEKKAAAACQNGLITVGIGGVWAWRATLDNGEKLTIPQLDEFQWTGRPVLICPDSDAWMEEKGIQILSGFFALAKELQRQGASVQFVRLPDISGRKTGLDDWLLVPGHDVDHSWTKLERIPLDDPRFHALTSWWQRWKEKQVTLVSLQLAPTETFDIQEIAGQYTVTFPVHHLQFKFERLTDARGGVQAELSISTETREILGVTDISLKTASARKNIASALKELSDTLPWKRMVDLACDAVLHRHRQGEPVIVLQPSDSINVPFVVNPIIYKDHQTLVFAPGGSLKSYLALFIALQACHGSHIAGLSALRVPVLYLDYELNAETVGGRLKALQAGHPELSHFAPYYRHCDAPLYQEVHRIAQQVKERGVKLLIVDSVALASGGDLSSPDAAIKLQQALRMIGCASLVLAHTSKTIQEGQEKTAFGTVFFRELARNVWELQRAEGADPVRIALHQKKDNFSAKHPALGFEFTFADESVQVTACNPADEPEFEDHLPLRSRIRNLLESDEKPRTSQEISDQLRAVHVSVRSALSRDKHKWMQVEDGSGTQKWTVLGGKK